MKAEHLARATALDERYGVLALVATRWIPWARTLLPHVAGATGMPLRRFLVADVVGALTWGATLVLLGRLSADVPVLKTVAAVVAGVFVGGSLLVAVVLAVRARLRRART